VAVLIAAMALIGCVHEQAAGTEPVPTTEAAAKPAYEPSRWLAAKGTALVVMDMQVGFMPVARAGTVVPAIQALVAAADAAGALVVWVYTDDMLARQGSSYFEVAPPLVPAEGHERVVKTGSSAFGGTDLAAILEARGIGRLVFCGLASNGCVRASVESSMGAGYLTVVAEDAHTVPTMAGTAESIDRMNELWRADGRVELLPAASISFAAP